MSAPEQAPLKVPTGIYLPLPEHILAHNQRYAGTILEGVNAQMELAVNLCLDHITHEGCGPFYSLVIEIETQRILCCVGNFVVRWQQSWAHGERVAFSLAQHMLQSFRLPEAKYRLVSTAQMCSVCWAESKTTGIAEIVTGATGEDVESNTPFKEGRLPSDWRAQLNRHGIDLHEEVLRSECCEPFKRWDGPNYFDVGAQTT